MTSYSSLIFMSWKLCVHKPANLKMLKQAVFPIYKLLLENPKEICNLLKLLRYAFDIF